MARVIETFSKTSAGYPWSVWTDGKIRVAEKGVDFTCTTSAFTASIYNYARRNNYQAITKVVIAKKPASEKVEFCFSRNRIDQATTKSNRTKSHGMRRATGVRKNHRPAGKETASG